jgi:hypothetical protein
MGWTKLVACWDMHLAVVLRDHLVGKYNMTRLTATRRWSLVNTICADGTYLKPIVVYKGKNFLIRWTDQENPIEASFMAFHSMSILEN